MNKKKNIPFFIGMLMSAGLFFICAAALAVTTAAADMDMTGSAPLPDLTSIFQQIAVRENELGCSSANGAAKLEYGEDCVSFTSAMETESEIPAAPTVPEMPFPEIPAIDSIASPQVRTLFNIKADTVEKRTLIKHGSEIFSFTATLDHQGMPYRQTTYSGPRATTVKSIFAKAMSLSILRARRLTAISSLKNGYTLPRPIWMRMARDMSGISKAAPLTIP